MIYFKLGLKNCWKQRRRNLFTLLSIMIGTAGLICLGAYINRWRHTLAYSSIYLSNVGTLAIYHKDGLRMSHHDPKRFTLTPDEQSRIFDHLKDDPRVEAIGRYLYAGGLASNGCESIPFEITGYDAELDHALRQRPEVVQWASNLSKFMSGKTFASYDQKNVVGVTKGLAKLLGKKATLSETQDVVPPNDLKAYCDAPGAKERIARDPNLQLFGRALDGQFSASDVEIAHIYSTGLEQSDDTKMTAPIELVQSLFHTENLSYLSVFLKDSTHAIADAASLEKALHDDGLDVDIYAWNDARLNPYYVGTMNFLYTIGFFFCILVFSIVTLSTINLTTMNVTERSREIGTLKAIGYKQNSIANIFLIESAILAGVSCAAGWLLSVVINFAVNSAQITFMPPGAALPAVILLIPDARASFAIAVIMFLIVTASAFFTCYKLSKRSCLELLTKV